MGRFLSIVIIFLASSAAHAQPSDLVLHAGDAAAFQGDIVPIAITFDNLSSNGVQGVWFQLASSPPLVSPLDVVMGSDSIALAVEYFAAVVDPFVGLAGAGIIVDFVEPFTGDTIPPGVGYELAIVQYEVVAVGPAVALLEFEADPSGVVYEFDDGSIVIVGDALRRGDADGNGVVNGFADALFLLAFQFQSGPEPPCFEAADCDADGVLQGLVDALYMLVFQFLGGPPPPAPYPDCGFDPDPATSLGCATPSCP